IRIPDVTAEDLEPVYVGTDANISYQGTPRVENPNRDAGPFDQGGKGTAPPVPPPTPPPLGEPPAINLAPAAPPTDIFRPTPPPPRRWRSGRSWAAGREWPTAASTATASSSSCPPRANSREPAPSPRSPCAASRAVARRSPSTRRICPAPPSPRRRRSLR